METTVDPTLLTAPYQLPDGAAGAFERDGFVHLRGVLDPAVVEHYEPEITEQVIALNTMHVPMAERDTYSKAFLQVTNLWQHSEKVRELVFSSRLARIAADLMGVRGTRLYHDQALYKEPGGGITPWHADQYYWPLVGDRCCTIWLPLQETPLPLGPLTFARGSHRFSVGRDLAISDESEARMQKALAEQDFPIVEEPFALGDASFHQGWMFHHASPNVSATPRRVMTVIYIDADIEIAEPVNTSQVSDLAGWFPGKRPGEVPDTALNPLLWARDRPSH